MHRIDLLRHLLLLAILTLIIGCESGDERLANYAQQSTAQQTRQNDVIAEQSREMARQSQEVTSASQELIQQDAAARRELIQAQRRLQEHIHEERSGVDRQREQVDDERKAVAQASAREPLIAQAILTTGLIGAALLPLIVTAYAIRRLPDQSPASELFAGALLENFLEQRSGPARQAPPPSLSGSFAPPHSNDSAAPAADGEPPRP
jgi:hypothetical protein